MAAIYGSNGWVDSVTGQPLSNAAIRSSIGSASSAAGAATDNLYMGYTPEQWQAAGAAGAVFDKSGKLTGAEDTVVGKGLGGYVFDDKGVTAPSGFSLDSVGGVQGLADIGKLGVGLGQLYLGSQQLGLAKDQFAYNKMAKDREYAANVAEYNNALARTAAVDKFYGTQSAGTPLKA